MRLVALAVGPCCGCAACRGVRPAAQVAPDEASAAPNANEAWEAVWRWLGDQTLEEFFPREAAYEVSDSTRHVMDGQRFGETLVKLITKAENQVRREERSARDLLGEEATERLIASVGESFSNVDESLVESFVRSRTVASILSALLYEAIYAFVSRTNFLGQFTAGLPVIGPIQDQLNRAIKYSIDRQLGDAIKVFLGEYVSVATDQILELANTPENRRGVALWASRVLTGEVLRRPLAELVPDQATMAALKRSAARLVQQPSGGAGRALVDFVYDNLGEDGVGGAAAPDAASSAAAVAPLSLGGERQPGLGPRTRAAIIGAWERFVTSSDGQEALVAAMASALGASARRRSRADGAAR